VYISGILLSVNINGIPLMYTVF